MKGGGLSSPRSGAVGAASASGAGDLGHRQVVQVRALPGLRVGAEREPDQLPVLLHAAGDGAEAAPLALELGADGDGPRLGDAQEVHRHRAGLALVVGDGQLQAPHQDRHHVAAQRAARRVPALGEAPVQAPSRSPC